MQSLLHQEAHSSDGRGKAQTVGRKHKGMGVAAATRERCKGQTTSCDWWELAAQAPGRLAGKGPGTAHDRTPPVFRAACLSRGSDNDTPPGGRAAPSLPRGRHSPRATPHPHATPGGGPGRGRSGCGFPRWAPGDPRHRPCTRGVRAGPPQGCRKRGNEEQFSLPLVTPEARDGQG